MDIYKEQDRLKKEIAQEEAERRQGVEERILKLAGRSISDLSSLKEYWISERKRNTNLNDAPRKRRLEAIYWIEAIDTIIQSGGISNQQEGKEEPKKLRRKLIYHPSKTTLTLLAN